MSRTRAMILAGSFLLFAGCLKPIPEEQSEYVGEWTSQTMFLKITQHGEVDYERVQEGARTSVSAPLQRFEGSNFVVGVGPFKTTFVVTNPPHEVQGEWKMTVDGIELTRAR